MNNWYSYFLIGVALVWAAWNLWKSVQFYKESNRRLDKWEKDWRQKERERVDYLWNHPNPLGRKMALEHIRRWPN